MKAGLKVSRGLTSEASARARAMVDSSVAAQLRSAEATSAATKMPSMWGRRVVQENGMLPCREVTEHWVSNRVPPRRMGREAALTTQATRAGRASRKRRLFRMGSKEVKIVATNASRAAAGDSKASGHWCVGGLALAAAGVVAAVVSGVQRDYNAPDRGLDDATVAALLDWLVKHTRTSSSRP